MTEANDVWNYMWNDKYVFIQILNSQGQIIHQSQMDKEECRRRGGTMTLHANTKLQKQKSEVPQMLEPQPLPRQEEE